MEEEYTGNFIFTQDEPPPGITDSKWQSLWISFSEQLEKGELPIDANGKIPQLLRNIYYSKSGWDNYGYNLPLRQIDEVQFTFSLKSGSQFGTLIKLKEALEKGISLIEIEGKHYYALLSENISFIRCEIKNLMIHQIYAEGANFSGSILEEFDISNSNLTSAVFKDTYATNCKFNSCTLLKSSFYGGKYKKCSFHATNLTKSYFSGTLLVGCEFYHSKLARTIFVKSDLSESSFSTKSLECWQVESCIVYNVRNDGMYEYYKEFIEDLGIITSKDFMILKRLVNSKHYKELESNRFSFKILISNLAESAKYNNKYFYLIEKGEKTVPITNILIGANGIMSPFDNSVSFFGRETEPDNMRGNSLQIVIDNLKRARWQLGFSFLLLGIFAWFAIFNKDIGLNDTIHLSKADFFEHSWVWPLINSVILVLVAQNMKTALDNTRSLRKRDDVAQVAAFPFPLSHYNSPPSWEHSYVKGEMYSSKWFGPYAIYGARAITGLIYVFHPVLLSIALFLTDYELSGNSFTLLLLLTVVVFFLCLWVFNLSQGFQVPILFDPTEEEDKN